MCFLHNKTSSRSTQTRQKDDTKFVILNATFNIFKVNATGSVYRGCIYFENLLSKFSLSFFIRHLFTFFSISAIILVGGLYKW